MKSGVRKEGGKEGGTKEQIKQRDIGGTCRYYTIQHNVIWFI